jgi:hypothetical protein
VWKELDEVNFFADSFVFFIGFFFSSDEVSTKISLVRVLGGVFDKEIEGDGMGGAVFEEMGFKRVELFSMLSY